MSRRAAPAAVCQAVHRRNPDRPRSAADGLQLCPGCVEGLRRHLQQLPDLYHDVADNLPTQGTAGGPPVSGSHGTPLPYNPVAGALKALIEHDLLWHVRWVAQARGHALPARGTVPDLCAWLGKHVEWMAAQQDAAHVREVFLELAGRAWAVIDPDRRPIVLGPCDQIIDDAPCDGTLRATVRRDDDPTPSEIYCDGCDLRIDSTQWRRFGHRYNRQREKMTG